MADVNEAVVANDEESFSTSVQMVQRVAIEYDLLFGCMTSLKEGCQDAAVTQFNCAIIAMEHSKRSISSEEIHAGLWPFCKRVLGGQALH